MSRASTLTLGFLLILVGLKLHFVESYQLTLSATRFWIERVEDPNVVMQNGLYQYVQNNGYNSPFSQTAYTNANSPAPFAGPQKVIKPPTWVCWPVFFLGAFLLLNGMALPKNS